MNNAKERPLILPAAAVAVFTVANGMIKAPYFSGSILPFVAAFILGVPAFCGVGILRLKLYGCCNLYVKRTALFIVFAFAGFAAILATSEFSRFIFDDVLVHENYLVIKAVFAVCVFALSVCEENVIYKFSLLCAVLVSTVFFVLFLTSVKTFDANNIKSALTFSDFSLKQTGAYFARTILPALIAAVHVCENKKAVKAGAFGIAWAFALCSLVLLDCILSFSLPLAAKLDYPYIDDISTVTVGSLFTRMDGFAYIAFFVCYLLKCALCVSLGAKCLEKAGLCHKKAICAALCIIALSVS
ncbi:MAG: GerAB/ArcD/ProY family transporter [Clostridia bacterium]|nr:GerAB/ArcD/ProY family transporter [Clostridia bacterium]